MTNADIRKGFDQVISKTTDAAARARMEVAREFFANPAFRKNLEDFTWQTNKAK